MALRGVPVLGAYVPQAEAAIRAAAQPLTGVGEPGASYAERYAKNLPQRQAQYAQAEQESPIASGAAQMLGGTLALAPLGATALGARALGFTGSLPARLGFGAASGAGLSAADTAARGGTPEDITGAAKWGAGIGAAAPIVAGGLQRAISPFLARDPVRAARIATLEAAGFAPTAGETTGSRPLQWMEQHYGELGGAKTAPQGERLATAAWQQAGQDASRVTPEVVDRAFTDLGNKFDSLAARNVLNGDAKLGVDMGQAAKSYYDNVAPPNRAPVIGNYIGEIVDALKTNNGTLPGAVYQSLHSRIEASARKAPYDVADALRGVKGALDSAMERSLAAANSPDLGAWQQVRKQYRNLLVMEKVATNPNTQNGIMTPAGLYQATKAVQGVRNMARGRGDLQPMAQAASDVLRGMPSSGTAQRTFYQNIPGMLSTGIVGAAGGAAGSGGDPTTALLGGLAGVFGPPLAGRALLSRPAQAYLANRVAAGPAGRMIPGGVYGGLLALQPPAPLPGMQYGGRPTGPTVVGEQGPEVFVPDRPGTIIPANGPMPSPQEISRYLAATTQNYPKFGAGGIPVNPEAFASAVQGWPESTNIEDRRDEQGGFAAAAQRTARGVRPPGGRQEGAGTQFVEGGYGLPAAYRALDQGAQRAVESAGSLQRGGSYDPAPVMQQAIGAATPLGPANAVRKAAMEYAAKAALRRRYGQAE
jgi:hypothetical protein